jgi:3-deoxy-D-manno-octulosonate 8-phosphate phosphatase (KDO 8-P phosphatase)
MTTTQQPTVRLFILDVDGVLTDGRFFYDSQGFECKAFHTQDGLGIKRLQETGTTVAILSGRNSAAVTQRAAELNITALYQGVSDKLPFYEQLKSEHSCHHHEIACIGDDLPDLPLIQQCGFGIAVNNAVDAVKAAARYCTQRPGGQGAVREACEWLLLQ